MSAVDELEIRNALALGCYLADEGSAAEVAQLLVADGTWQMSNGTTWTGRAQVEAGLQELRGSGVAGPGSGTRHLLTTVWVSAEEGGAARSRARWMLVRAADGVLLSVGDYHDQWSRHDGGWLLRARRIERLT